MFFAIRIVGRGFLTPLFLKILHILVTKLFKLFRAHPVLIFTFFALFPYLFVWLRPSNVLIHSISFVIMELVDLLSFSSLVPEPSSGTVSTTRCQDYWSFHTAIMGFSRSLIWYHTQKYKYIQRTERQTDNQAQINIYQHHLLCAHNSYLYYTELITRWNPELTLHNMQCLWISKIYHSQKS